MLNEAALHYLKGKTVLITGAAGSVGTALAAKVQTVAKGLRCFDHAENELFFLQKKLVGQAPVSPQLGDIRDLDRLRFAMHSVDVVFHCAALKHVALGEYNPFEVVQSNLVGLQNVVRAALDSDVDRVIFTSSDKAVNPTNVMGASKMMGERLISAANEIRGSRRTRFSTVRFGNVIGSNGSVVPIFANQLLKREPVTITDANMTRYIMTVDEAAELVIDAGARMRGGEVFVTKMRAIRIADLAQCMADVLAKGELTSKVIGIQPGEKLYEELLTHEERPRALDIGELLVVLPPEGSEFPDKPTAAHFANSKIPNKEWHSTKDEPLSRAELSNYLKEKNILANWSRS